LEEPSEEQVKKSYQAQEVSIEIVPYFALWLEVAKLVKLGAPAVLYLSE